MVKVLIVDDERLAVKYYAQLINWQYYGFEIVGTAYDGKEALHVLEAKEPDIILTDIKMPVMDGIEFAQKARAINPDIHVLFITSYTDFNYTYSALKLGADDYIMKDLINEEVMVQKLLEIERKINVKRNEDFYKTERVIEEVFSSGRIDSGKLDWLGERAQRILEGKFLYLYLRQDRLLPSAAPFFQEESEKTENDRRIVEICRNFSDTLHRPISVFRYANGVLSVIKASNPDPIEFAEYVKQLQNRLKAALHQSFSAFTVSAPRTLTEAGRLYGNQEAHTEARIFFNRMLILEISSPELDTTPVEEPFDAGFVEQQIKSNGIAELQNYLMNFYEDANRKKDFKAFDFAFSSCLNLLKKYGQGLHPAQSGKGFSPQPSGHDKESMYVAQDAMLWLVEKFELMFSVRDEGAFEHYSKDTLEIVRYIMKHYGNSDLDVDSIAKGVAMSMTRSEVKFKLETGLTLIEYLNHYRIQKATEMLMNGDVKIYEISEKVGFTSSQYFSKVFKKYTFLTPIEYRKRLTDETYQKHHH